MSKERTLCIIKPDAVEAKNAGNILALLEAKGFEIVELKKKKLTMAEAEGFYAVHKERGFFGELCEFMTRGPVVIAVLASVAIGLAYDKRVAAVFVASSVGVFALLRVIAALLMSVARRLPREDSR
jgi:nucleoside-diphosphate kinase